MYSVSIYSSMKEFTEMRSYYRMDNVSKIFRDAQALARTQAGLAAPSRVCTELHIVKIWGHGIVKIFEATVKRNHAGFATVALTEL